MRTLRPFAALPSVAVVERLGQRGLLLQRLARGEWSRTLVPFEAPLGFEETCELEYPVENLEPLAFLLNRMLEQLCARLRARSLATNEVRLTFELDSSAREEDVSPRRHGVTEKNEEENQKEKEFSVSQCLRGEKDFARTVKLPVPMQDARVLLKLLQLDLAAHPPGAPVAKLALRAEPVKPRATQDGFFVPVAPEPEKLELLLARAAAIVGEENIGAAEVLDSHRPDAHRLKTFRVANNGTSTEYRAKPVTQSSQLAAHNSSAARPPGRQAGARLVPRTRTRGGHRLRRPLAHLRRMVDQRRLAARRVGRLAPNRLTNKRDWQRALPDVPRRREWRMVCLWKL